ncbi:MAG: hypothetical protein JRN52_02050 [Nitrososphaerota archaeon]|nr:hypothetical protein [Nitrososphaerota archaeon]
MSPIEMARGFKLCIKKGWCTDANSIARRFGISAAHVRRLLNSLEFDEDIQKRLHSKQLPLKTAEKLHKYMKQKDVEPEIVSKVLDVSAKNGLKSDQTFQIIDRLVNEDGAPTNWAVARLDAALDKQVKIMKREPKRIFPSTDDVILFSNRDATQGTFHCPSCKMQTWVDFTERRVWTKQSLLPITSLK